ncbi:MAG: sensor histidine kinase [Planctomycetota bacterium]
MDNASTTAERGLRAAGLLAWAGAALPLVLTVMDRGLSPRRALALVAFLVFGAAFVYATAPARRRRSHLLAGIGLQFVAAASAAFIYPATATFVLTVIVAIQFPFVFPLRGALLAVLAQTILVAGAYRGAPARDIAALIAIYGAFQVFGLITTWLMEREQAGRIQLEAAHAQLLSTRQLLADRVRRAERDRLAADLHDVLGHELVALRVNLEASRRHEGEAARDHLGVACDIAGRLLDDVRDLVHATSGGTVDLGAALAELRDGVPRPRVHLDIDDPLDVADADAAEAALRCAQEALTNAIKHGGADNVWIDVHRRPHRLVVGVRDDGSGASGSEPGSGLQAMRERAERLGGALDAGNDPDGGFRISMEIPVREERR